MSDPFEAQKKVFLSYRREGGWQSARLVYQDLKAHDYDVFMDVESIGNGEYPPVLEHQIEARPHFVIVLSPRAFSRARNAQDWLRREIVRAVRCARNIVPLLFDRFTFDDEEFRAAAAEVEEIRALGQQNAVDVHDTYFDAAMTKLREHFLTRCPTGAVAPTPPKELVFVEGMLHNAERADGAHVVSVFYATDRQRRALSWNPDRRFLGSRSRETKLNFGRCQVSIPPAHRMNQVERPSWLRLGFREETSRHIVIQDLAEMSPSEFQANLESQVAESERKRALVSLHGYNVTFGHAVRRTAQLCYDLHFDGLAITYSWPSRGKLVSYSEDESNVQWSVPHLDTFLRGLRKLKEAETIDLIAHGMGCRVLIEALSRIVGRPDSTAKIFRQIILVAPDVDADIFRDRSVGFTAIAERVTLYASSSDAELKVSRAFHGGHLRAGDTEPQLVVTPGVDIIDASDVSVGLGHSYYSEDSEDSEILQDIFYLLKTGAPPSERPSLTPCIRDDLTYWALRP